MTFVYSLIFGLLFGYIAEFIFKSITRSKIVLPILANVYMYGVVAGFAWFLFFFWNPNFWIVAILGLITTTGIEYLTGQYYLTRRNVQLWNYLDTKLNYRGILNPFYSVLWIILFLLFYYKILPLIFKL